MVLVDLVGGLGNQMFQYALVTKLRELGKKAYLRPCFGPNSGRRIELSCFEGYDDKVFYECSDVANGLVERFRKVVYKIRGIIMGEYKDRIIVFQPNVFSLNNVRLSGYWQNEKYFADISGIIRSKFSFKPECVERWESSVKNIYGRHLTPEDENSVSVHIRRTDYLLPSNERIYGGICTEEYYINAVSYFVTNTDNPMFYFFSDDIEWVKNTLYPKLKGINANQCYFMSNPIEEVAMDMWLMTRCQNHIIANSTYSWWGAWLDDKKNKLVIAPSKWMNGYSDDIICTNWIRL